MEYTLFKTNHFLGRVARTPAGNGTAAEHNAHGSLALCQWKADRNLQHPEWTVWHAWDSGMWHVGSHCDTEKRYSQIE